MTDGIVRAVEAVTNVPRRGSLGEFVLGNVNTFELALLGVITLGRAEGDGTNVFTVRGVRMPRPVP
jgi:hypothetical protein